MLWSRSAAPKCRPAGDTYSRSRSPSGTLGIRRAATGLCRDSNSIVADSEPRADGEWCSMFSIAARGSSACVTTRPTTRLRQATWPGIYSPSPRPAHYTLRLRINGPIPFSPRRLSAIRCVAPMINLRCDCSVVQKGKSSGTAM
jgi:hypothetical protein